MHLTRRTTLLALAALPLARPLYAAPQSYRINTNASRVAFIFKVAGARQSGQMPVLRSDVVIDPERLTQSRVDVTVSAARVRTGLFVATQALKTSAMLDVARHPEIRYRSRKIQLGSGGRLSDGARITGDLTIRGVTRPIVMDAALHRATSSASTDLSRLNIRLKGLLDRMAFGIDGYPQQAGNEVQLEITAVLDAV